MKIIERERSFFEGRAEKEKGIQIRIVALRVLLKRTEMVGE